jgi:hypothetical protein
MKLVKFPLIIEVLVWHITLSIWTQGVAFSIDDD